MFDSVLVANRGEVAVRILRACYEMQIRGVAVYSEADENALHVRLADDAYCIGGATASESYLSIDNVLDAAREAKVDAIHPGYGLLSESAEFAQAVVDAGFVFIGPSAALIQQMGDKLAARKAAKEAGLPLLQGSEGIIKDKKIALELANKIGFPLLVKACFGGGGRGMRIVQHEGELVSAIEQAEREANTAFGKADVYLEQYISRGRHIEVQILGDTQGNIVHLGDRDCSVQRRHQKLIEEAPAPDLSDDVRQKIANAAVKLANSVNYQSAGTVEFLLNADTNDFYFLEMNTRLQVEHGVTEMVTGCDLVQWQINIANGQVLDFKQQQVKLNGHAIQARIAAEDPWQGFVPQTGEINQLNLPTGPGVRLDFAVETGDSISPFYDSMFGKIQVWANHRTAAIARLENALKTLQVDGVATTAPYLKQVLQQPDFIDVKHDTTSLERDWQTDNFPQPKMQQNKPMPDKANNQHTESRREVAINTPQGAIGATVFGRIYQGVIEETMHSSQAENLQDETQNSEPIAPIDGCVIEVSVSVGDKVKKGDVLVILEAMKMELPVKSARDGKVSAVLTSKDEVVVRGKLLVELD